MSTTEILGIVSPVPIGAWNNTTTYQKLNIVRYNGAVYIAKTSNIAVEPGVSINWQSSWMPLVYDGGTVAPDGTYPDLTAGQVLYPLSFGSKTYNGSSAQTVTAADLGVASAYIPQGSITFANLPSTPSAATLSYVWDISDQFTTDSRFIEGTGQTYSAGTNVGVVEQNGNYYYDVFGSFVDLSNYAQIEGTYSGMTVGNATNSVNVTQSIGGQALTNIFESNGTTVKNATSATNDANGTPISLSGIMVGEVKLFAATVNPSETLGGTWEQLTADAYFKIVTTGAGATGGTSASHTIPLSSMPSHNHNFRQEPNTGTGGLNEDGATIQRGYASTNSSFTTIYELDAQGGGQPYYPYYFGVYAWKRIA